MDTAHQPQSLFELLKSEEFRRRPAMYVGDFNFLRFQSFVAGYSFCQYTHGIKEEEENRINEFFESVAKHFKRDPPAGWALIIWAEKYGNGPYCYIAFFELFDRFFKIRRRHNFYSELLEVYEGKRKQTDLSFDR